MVRVEVLTSRLWWGRAEDRKGGFRLGANLFLWLILTLQVQSQTFANTTISPTILASMPDAAAWKERSIYQILTDRFAVAGHGNGGPSCDYTAGKYCGGTWQGIISKLDYIQGMGFDAIWISPVSPKKFRSHVLLSDPLLKPHRSQKI